MRNIRSSIGDIPPRLGQYALVIIAIEQGVLGFFAHGVLPAGPGRDSVRFQTCLRGGTHQRQSPSEEGKGVLELVRRSIA